MILASARILVVKIGSSLLVDEATGAIRREWLDALADDVAACRARDQQMVLVSSGAVATGRRHLGLTGPRLKLEEKQAAAATGQIRLAHAYQEALARHGITVAQILLTPGDTEERRRHLNARATIRQLLELGAGPIINENDTVATSEIRFADNDRLAARVAQMIGADTLLLLSDIDGLYTANPRLDRSATLVRHVPEITPAIEAMAGAALPGYSSGGMVTKLQAARIATSAGCRMAISLGQPLHPLARLDDPATPCTWFKASGEPRTARKRWISSHLKPAGTITIDPGAARALQAGGSLLPAGVTAVEGAFDRGDAVTITAEGRVVGHGLAAYSSGDAKQIAGRNSRDIETLLGYRGRDELVHRDDLVLH